MCPRVPSATFHGLNMSKASVMHKNMENLMKLYEKYKDVKHHGDSKMSKKKKKKSSEGTKHKKEKRAKGSTVSLTKNKTRTVSNNSM